MVPSTLAWAVTRNVPADYPTIQCCIDAADDGDECLVAPGTYHETIDFLGKAIAVRSIDGPDVTTIDATGLGGSVVTCTSGEGPNTVVDGLAITGGTGTYLSMLNGYVGGGMYIAGSSPTVTKCVFSVNRATYGGGIYSADGNMAVSNSTFRENTAFAGGGMNNKSGSPTVANCKFSANAAQYGGGTLNSGDAALADCTFSGNIAFSGGGGMYNHGSPVVTRCIFIGNRADYNGGGMYNSNGSPMVIACTFSGNAARYGGGMKNDAWSDPTVTACMFSENKAAREGGGMYNNVYSSPTLTRCMFNGNSAALYGGGMYNYGNRATARSCTFSRNTARYGGGVFNDFDSLLIVTHGTFSENIAQDDFGNGAGGAMYNADGSALELTNSILWGNSPNEIVNGSKSPPIVGFSDIQGGLPVHAIDAGGNVNLDPMFVRSPDPGPDGVWAGVNDDYGDLRLRAGSPCIDAGDPEFVPQESETDLDGHARVLCGRVDMGAYEFGIGDYDCNRTVDLSDIAAWESCMTGAGDGRQRAYAPGCDAFDFNADSAVDLRDFARWQQIVNAP